MTNLIGVVWAAIACLLSRIDSLTPHSIIGVVYIETLSWIQDRLRVAALCPMPKKFLGRWSLEFFCESIILRTVELPLIQVLVEMDKKYLDSRACFREEFLYLLPLYSAFVKTLFVFHLSSLWKLMKDIRKGAMRIDFFIFRDDVSGPAESFISFKSAKY